MAKMNGCNADMPKGPIGKNSTRMNPNSFARNNLAMGGTNAHGSNVGSEKPKLSAGSNGTGKHRHDKR